MWRESTACSLVLSQVWIFRSVSDHLRGRGRRKGGGSSKPLGVVEKISSHSPPGSPVMANLPVFRIFLAISSIPSIQNSRGSLYTSVITVSEICSSPENECNQWSLTRANTLQVNSKFSAHKSANGENKGCSLLNFLFLYDVLLCMSSVLLSWSTGTAPIVDRHSTAHCSKGQLADYTYHFLKIEASL